MSRTPALARSHVAPRAICISRLAGRPAVVRETEGRFLEEDEYKVPLRSPQHPPISSRHHPERALPAPPKHIRQQQQPTTTATAATASRMLLPIPLLLFALLAPATSSPLADADADADADLVARALPGPGERCYPYGSEYNYVARCGKPSSCGSSGFLVRSSLPPSLPPSH